MIIKNLTGGKRIPFSDLKIGDTFKRGNWAFLKIAHHLPPNAYDLSDRCVADFDSTQEVEYIPSELILHSPDWEKK